MKGVRRGPKSLGNLNHPSRSMEHDLMSVTLRSSLPHSWYDSR